MTELSKNTKTPNLLKPLLGDCAFVSLKNIWCVFDEKGNANQYSISHSKPAAIKKFLQVWISDSKFAKWRYWKNKNYNCINVNIQFTKNIRK